jgi:glycosyltransferase involved in cell wall biosynthesis
VINVGLHNANSFALAGHETHFVVGRGDESDTADDLRQFYGLQPDARLHIHRVARRAFFGTKSSVPIFLHAVRLIRQLSAREQVSALAREPSFLPYLAWLARDRRIHTYYEAHNFFADLSWRKDRINLQDRRQGWLERVCLPRMRGVVAIVDPQAELYAKRFPSIRVKAFPLGCDPVAPGDRERRRRERRAVYVGHMHTAKGVKTLLKAVNPAESGLRAAFWGGGEAQIVTYRGRLSEDAATRIEFAPFRTPQELQTDLATRASVGIVALHDTYYNSNLTCPAKALDYLAHGLPIIASDLPSNRSVLANAAIYVPPDDPAALRAALLGLLDDADAYRHWSEQSWRRADELSWVNRARRLSAWMEEP